MVRPGVSSLFRAVGPLAGEFRITTETDWDAGLYPDGKFDGTVENGCEFGRYVWLYSG